MGAARLMVLQPFSAFKTPQSPEEAAFTLYKYREEILKVLYERTTSQLETLARQDKVGYLDARHIYDNKAEHIFFDDVHLTSLGYEELAVAISRQIALVNAPCTR
jgi:hypothetical protein